MNNHRPRRDLKTVLEYVSTILTLAVCVTLLYRAWHPDNVTANSKNTTRTSIQPPPPLQPVPTAPVALSGAPMQGSATARTGLLVFSDFECPYCAKFATTVWPLLLAEYVEPGKLRVAFRHLPLKMHPNARPAALAAECAGRQGKFWEMHDLLFADQKNLADAALSARAKRLGLTAEPFDTCRQGDGARRLQEDERMAAELKITGTPTFMLGTISADGRLLTVSQRWSGSGSIKRFEEAIGPILTAAK